MKVNIVNATFFMPYEYSYTYIFLLFASDNLQSSQVDSETDEPSTSYNTGKQFVCSL